MFIGYFSVIRYSTCRLSIWSATAIWLTNSAVFPRMHQRSKHLYRKASLSKKRLKLRNWMKVRDQLCPKEPWWKFTTQASFLTALFLTRASLAAILSNSKSELAKSSEDGTRAFNSFKRDKRLFWHAHLITHMEHRAPAMSFLLMLRWFSRSKWSISKKIIELSLKPKIDIYIINF